MWAVEGLHRDLQPRIEAQRLSGIDTSARVADYVRLFDQVVRRPVHVAMDPQGGALGQQLAIGCKGRRKQIVLPPARARQQAWHVA